jgi:hypothetical protein
VNSIKVVFALEVMMRQLCGGEAVEASVSRFIDCAAIYIQDVILLNVLYMKHCLGRFFPFTDFFLSLFYGIASQLCFIRTEAYILY